MAKRNSTEEIIAILHTSQINLGKGMADSEIERAEKCYSIHFPPDLRELLQTALPISPRFYNWRDFSDENQKYIYHALDAPYRGICFDIEYNEFWLDELGAKPMDFSEQCITLKEYMKNVPKLIPIYAHRFIPEMPCKRDNPVFSVHQTDIIYYGKNLLDYFKHEFRISSYDYTTPTNKTIPFWTQFCI